MTKQSIHIDHYQGGEETENISASPLYSEDFAPVAPSARTWTTWNYAALWIGMAVCIPTYMLAGSMIREGMNWWQALLTILLGNLIVLLPVILNAHAGARYGLPLPVLFRAAFGTRGAVLAALLRGLIGCGWFGIQTWIGGKATRSFFEQQITAAKLIQQYWFDKWAANGLEEQLTFRDLNSEVRLALLELGDQILLTISELRLWKKPRAFLFRQHLTFINALTTEGLGRREKRLLYEATTQIEGR